MPHGDGEEPLTGGQNSGFVHHNAATDVKCFAPDKVFGIGIVADLTVDSLARHDAPNEPKSAQRVDPDHWVKATGIAFFFYDGDGLAKIGAVVTFQKDRIVAVGLFCLAGVEGKKGPATFCMDNSGNTLPDAVAGVELDQFCFACNQHMKHSPFYNLIEVCLMFCAMTITNLFFFATNGKIDIIVDCV